MTPATQATTTIGCYPETHSGEEIVSATTNTPVASHAHVLRNRRRSNKRAEDSTNYPSAATHASNLRRLSPKADCKIHLANERTFISWLHMSVTVGSLSSLVVGLSWKQLGRPEREFKRVKAPLVGIILLPVAMLFCVYAATSFHQRLRQLKTMPEKPFDAFYGPILMALVMVFALWLIFIISLLDYFDM